MSPTTGLDEAVERRDWSSKRAHDIITLGLQVGELTARAERAEAALSDCMVALREAAWRFGYTATLMRKDPAMACLAPSMDEAADDARAVHTRLASSTLCRVEGEGVG
jgi:hypothetical protein